MIRLLLTFLALMTGLASAGPATAAPFAGARAQVSAGMVARGEARVSLHVQAHAAAIARPYAPAALARVAVLAPLAVLVPAVRMGVDRARE